MHSKCHNSKQQGTIDHKIKTYCIVPYCSTSNPGTNAKIKTTNAVPRRHSSQIPPVNQGGKQTKSIRAVGIQESKKEKREKRKVGRSTGMPPGEEESRTRYPDAETPPLAWLALCHAKRKKRDMLSLCSKREKKQKVGLLSKPPPSQIMPLSPYRLMSSRPCSRARSH